MTHWPLDWAHCEGACGEDIVGELIGETERFESGEAGVRRRVVV